MNPVTRAGSRAREFVLDAYSALSHKAPLQDTVQSRINGYTARSWVGPEHQRRLAAYQVLAAYEQNVSREFLDTSDDVDREDRREYGDAGLIVDTVLAALLGETQEIVVPGAEKYDPDLDTDPGPDADEDAVRAAREAATENGQARVLSERQEFLRTWADSVHLQLRLTDCARNEVRDGDGVILLGYDTARGRVVPAVMDPGFYFPVLPDSLDAYEYPTRVHFAWEIPADQFGDDKVRVRRLTYEVRPMFPEYLDDVADDGTPVEILPDGARWRENPGGFRELVRTYPWEPDQETTLACYLTDATWILDDLIDPDSVDAFTLEGASYALDADGVPLVDYDLGIDFLPVVHVPNTPPGGDHFGQSSLARVLQLLDDLQNADTDAQRAASTVGSPPIGISGEATAPSSTGTSSGRDFLTGQRGAEIEMRPGAVWRLGANGGLFTVNTSPNLAEARHYVQSLRDRLLVNSRLPGALVGTVKPSEVPSGFALQLSFGPLSAMIRQMRLVRAVKHPLMLKMVQRLAQAAGDLPPGPTPRAELALGSFLPADQAGTLALVREAFEAKLISLETAVGMLLEAGFSIDDVAEEIANIEGRDFDGANALADATGDNAAVRDYLGLEPVDDSTGVGTAPGIQSAAEAAAAAAAAAAADAAGAPPIAGGTGVGEPNATDSGAGRS